MLMTQFKLESIMYLFLLENRKIQTSREESHMHNRNVRSFEITETVISPYAC